MLLVNSETPTMHPLCRLFWKFRGTHMERAFYSTILFRKDKDTRKIVRLVTSTLNLGRKGSEKTVLKHKI